MPPTAPTGAATKRPSGCSTGRLGSRAFAPRGRNSKPRRQPPPRQSRHLQPSPTAGCVCRAAASRHIRRLRPRPTRSATSPIPRAGSCSDVTASSKPATHKPRSMPTGLVERTLRGSVATGRASRPGDGSKGGRLVRAMRARLRQGGHRSRYRLRKHVVEPVFATASPPRHRQGRQRVSDDLHRTQPRKARRMAIRSPGPEPPTSPSQLGRYRDRFLGTRSVGELQ
jgi:hypothetical protein